MAKDRLKSRIAEALAEPSPRDSLRRLLSREGGAPPALEDARRRRRRCTTILENVKDPILTLDAGRRRAQRERRREPDIRRDRGASSPARSVDQLIPDLARERTDARRARGSGRRHVRRRAADGGRGAARRRQPFKAEVTVSRSGASGHGFVMCLRDITERLQDEQALRESEARYRALVENAPEAIVVLDVDQQRFVDANENAVKLFKLTREKLLEVGPRALSPEVQSDGSPSFGLTRGYVDRALNGGRPVFEWLHRDADGNDVPCEVRFIRLPSSKRRLIRASIIDIAARRQADTLAYGERRVLELIAANAPLERTLNAVVRLVEQLHPTVGAAVMRLEGRKAQARGVDRVGRAGRRRCSRTCRWGSNAGRARRRGVARPTGHRARHRRKTRSGSSCATCRSQNGLRACCSTPIVTSDDRIHGTLDLYFDSARGPKTEELDLATRLTQLLGIAIRRKLDESALRDSEARFRALFDNVVDGVYQVTPAGEIVSMNPALVRMLGYDDAKELGRQNVADLFVEPKERERLVAELKSYGRVRNFEYRLRRRDGREIVAVENSRVVSDAHGRELYYEGTVTDITQRKAAERALFNEKERAQVTLQSIGDAVVTTDEVGNIEYLNPVAEQLTGWERRDAEGLPIGEIVRLSDESTGAVVREPGAALPRRGPRRGSSPTTSCSRAATAPRSRSRTRPRRSRTATAWWSARSWCSTT